MTTRVAAVVSALLFAVALSSVTSRRFSPALEAQQAGSDGPAMWTDNPNRHRTGNRASGKTAFRMETFGDEGFWLLDMNAYLNSLPAPAGRECRQGLVHAWQGSVRSLLHPMS
jgi:hypothetical protein